MFKYLVCCLALLSLTTTANSEEAIAYRLPNWKTAHFDDARTAERHLAAVKNLGCEAKLDSHSGHADVVYRVVAWRSLEVATDELAHQWEAWMKQAGFETVHGHATVHGKDNQHAGHDHAGHNHGASQVEEVFYTLPTWKTMHSDDPRRVGELIALMKGLGCEVQTESHGDHTDVKVRCSDLKHIDVADHRSAIIWQEWLKKRGFETRHSH